MRKRFGGFRLDFPDEDLRHFEHFLRVCDFAVVHISLVPDSTSRTRRAHIRWRLIMNPDIMIRLVGMGRLHPDTWQMAINAAVSRIDGT